jgi:TRAP-type uncharacterized transport system substrate-binding protein
MQTCTDPIFQNTEKTMARHKIREMAPRTILSVLIPLLLIIAVYGSYHFFQPVPPRTIVMTTGMESGSYLYFGERYRQVLARSGIQLKLLPSSGSFENLRRLMDGSQQVSVGLVQGGISKLDDTSNLVSLGSIYYSPLWVFYRGKETLDDLSQLSGKRITIGPEGSGVRKFALDLLKIANVSGPPTELFDFPTAEAIKAIMEGRVDAVITFGTADSPIVSELLSAPDVNLMSFSMAEAYSRLFPKLSHVVLPRGILNPSKKLPPADVHLLSATTNLIVSKNLHPALVYLLLKAAVEIHGGAGWLNVAGEFPSLKTQDYPISEEAQRFYKSGGSFLYDYLPFWAATFLDRMILILIPLGVVLIPAIGIAPWVFTYRNRSRFYRFYRELMEIEKKLAEPADTNNIRAMEAEIDRIEEDVGKIRVSIVFYDEIFILKEHIEMVRKKHAHASDRLHFKDVDSTNVSND